MLTIMSSENIGLTFSPSNERAIKRWTTGYPTVEIHIVRQYMQTTAGTTPLNFFKARDGYQSGVFTHGTEASLKHPKLADDYDYFMDFIVELALTGYDYWEQSLYDVPTVDKDLTYKCLLFNELEDDFIAGWKGLNLPQLKHDGGAASTITETLTGISWEDASAGTKDRHWTKVRQYFHSKGVNARSNWPSGTATLAEATKKKTAFLHTVRLYLGAAAIELMWNEIMAYANSAIAISKMAASRSEFAEKYTEYGESHGFDPFLDLLLAPTSRNFFTGFTVSGYSAKSVDILDTTIVDNADVLKLLYNYKSEIQVPKSSIEIGRKYWGVGKYTRGNQEKHFINIMIGAKNTSGGDYDTHGISTFAPLIGETLLLPWFREWNTLKFHNLMAKVVVEQKSYTYKAVAPLFGDFFAPFNIAKTLNGYAEESAYLGVRPIFRFATYSASLLGNTGDATDLVENNPQDIHTSDTLKIGHANYMNGIVAYLAVGDDIPPDYVLSCPNGMTREDLQAIMYFANKFSLTSSTSWGDHRFIAHKIQLGTVCDAINRDDIKGLMYSDSAEVKRIELVKDPTDHTNNKFIAMKYTYGLEDGVVANGKLWLDSRPRGEESGVILFIGEIECQLALASLLTSGARAPQVKDISTVSEADPAEEPSPETQTEEEQ